LQDYAKTKALGEIAVTKACCRELMTVSIAPHQVFATTPTFQESVAENLKIPLSPMVHVCRLFHTTMGA
jgi:hypothetical protein